MKFFFSNRNVFVVLILIINSCAIKILDRKKKNLITENELNRVKLGENLNGKEKQIEFLELKNMNELKSKFSQILYENSNKKYETLNNAYNNEKIERVKRLDNSNIIQKRKDLYLRKSNSLNSSLIVENITSNDKNKTDSFILENNDMNITESDSIDDIKQIKNQSENFYNFTQISNNTLEKTDEDKKEIGFSMKKISNITQNNSTLNNTISNNEDKESDESPSNDLKNNGEKEINKSQDINVPHVYKHEVVNVKKGEVMINSILVIGENMNMKNKNL